MTTISTPTELITAVPFLLHSQPESALVLIALSEGVVELAIEVQLPTSAPSELGEEFLAPLRATSVDQLLLLAYLPTDYEREQGVIIAEQLLRHCEEIAPVKDFLIIHRGRWRSFLCKDEECCDPAGQALPDIASSQIAAEHVFQGLVMPPLSEQSKEPPRLDQLIEEAHSEFQRCEATLRSKRGVIALLRLITHFTIHGAIDDERIAADALVGLSDIQVRDFAIGSHGDENLELHQKLWQALLEIAPPGFRAPVATLLALVHYEGRDSQAARSALERSLCDDPHYSLAHLLQKTFAAGWPPEAFTTMRHELHPKLRAELLS